MIDSLKTIGIAILFILLAIFLVAQVFGFASRIFYFLIENWYVIIVMAVIGLVLKNKSDKEKQ
ncbi:hypothetical protein [Labilibaculum euxinus]|uniref:Uncharacterized protein n=1 Tax=Labilibaculum euxinus TaxID=2686357 RepID=A0A7M4D2D5_9BACT|nr:hypothetical protein [Labilibaculum euxinus]MUP36814.1 hypothetical protein [Labilibaculum euxinus]MVB06019.1 hypothetical protein [Labilibaculum euxinus]